MCLAWPIRAYNHGLLISNRGALATFATEGRFCVPPTCQISYTATLHCSHRVFSCLPRNQTSHPDARLELSNAILQGYTHGTGGMQRQQAVMLEHPQGGSRIGDHDCRWGCCREFERASGDGGFDAEAEVSWFWMCE